MEIYPQVNRDWPGLPVSAGYRGGHELLTGSGFVRVPLGVIRVSGDSRLSWLETVTTQKLAGLAPGVGSEALVLDVQGRIELAFYLVDDGHNTWILTEVPEATRVFLDAMRFRSKVEITDCSQEFVVLGFLGSSLGLRDTGAVVLAGSLGASLGELAKVVWIDPWPRPVGETTVYTLPEASHPGLAPHEPEKRILAVIPPENIPTFEAQAAANHLVEADLGVWEAVRIARWRPRLGREGMPGMLPHELDWLRSAVSLNKGCYTGQETVAKLVNRGRPPRRLVFLDLDGTSEELPRIGTELRLATTGEPVGNLTSVAYHPTDGQIALGVVKRQTDPEALLELIGPEGNPVRAAQTIIVNPSGDNPKRFDATKLATGLGMRAHRGGNGRKLGGLGNFGKGTTPQGKRGIGIGMKGNKQ
ncbi:glycine cleavage T-protein C-terminal barrel domain protein [Mobiluncus mulieris 28-1]|uniref:Putative global regulator n=1 Tax=Mobiluncus mulieris TaxID=2052 RepID=A0A8G2HS48_9ACTO|nr:folate-binding protein YgfZ [Mobiluncus mulieris]EEZ92239.1 glycine cleavage T-protein C-terminal barrel domain protein [Mobiluncus mulieris 28-1]EFN92575.1 glycine cleavage T-protein C-terminal barrel domain protein [Mobiluncus mulieris FB024-16]MBB5845230.1 folate-binding protein YgfZ [Mobiluncus mulieris]MCU9997160.1 folate-binding protein YgfZ [Mobiluncus mulieris]MCV0003230.1 folate-binding protein YgfZ [Mobiluncus mulieris]